MGMVEFARASGDASFDQVGLEVFRHVLDYAFHPEKLGRPSLEGQRPASALNVPMIVLNVIDEIRDQEADKARQQWFEEEAQWCVAEILKHVKPEAKMVYEEVGADGAVLDDTSAGRLLNPGHAIEAGWFLMHHEQLCDRLAGKPARRGAEAGPLSALGVRMIEWSFDAGWDPAHGGLFYFLDSKGFSPSQLEWNMKLWWPHCESLVGTLMAFRFGGDRRHLDRFLRTLNYTLAHFACTPHGEWYGYLDREGRVTHRLVGGAYKCCFHVPRALMLCTTMLREMVGAAKDAAGK
jgi:N-acylglucosamine 2-epimerase